MELKHDFDEGTLPCLEKQRRSEDAQKELLSGLPDEILLQILSSLPIKDAGKTVVIRGFGSLWRSIPILDFDQCLYHSCYNGPYRNQKFINLIHQVVKFNESKTLDKLRLRFPFHKGCDGTQEDQVLKSIAAEIDSLVHYAIRKKVKVIDLDLLGCGYVELIEEYSVPDVVFRNDDLMEMRLAFCDIEFQGEISLRSLKILSLKGIELSDKMMEKILIGCPSLEDLTLIGCSGLNNLNCSNNPNLTKINAVLHMGKTLTLSCQEVASVEIAGCVESARLLDLPSVIDASLFTTSRFKCEGKVCHEAKGQLHKFGACKKFTPPSSGRSVLEFTNVPCPCFKWENQTLNLNFTTCHRAISLLLRKSQCVKTLELNVSRGLHNISKV